MKISLLKQLCVNFFRDPVVIRISKILLIAAIILLAVIIRMDTFWLSHLGGDQALYLGLAMKLDYLGFDYFSLRGIKEGTISLDPENKVQLAVLAPTDDPLNDKGDILRIFESVGVTYYDQPFYHKPPAFPYMLLLSHKFLAKPEQPYVVVATHIGKAVKRLKPYVFFQTQFYAAIVPFMYSLGFIFLTFLIGRKLFSFRVGVYSALMIATNGMEIVTAYKLFTEEMLNFFIALAFLLFLHARERRSLRMMFLSGITCGIAVLTKQVGGFLLIALWIFTFIDNQGNVRNIKDVPSFLFDKYMIAVSAGVFLVSGFWFYKIYSLYGHPLWVPQQPVNPSGWAQVLRSRPDNGILYIIGIPAIYPLFAIAYISLKDLFVNLYRSVMRKSFDYRFLILWIIIFTFGYIMRGGSEHRRMISVYPMIAMLSGYYLEKFILYRGKYSRFLGNRALREIVVVILFVFCAMWSVSLGLETVYANRQLITVPF